MQLTGPPKIGDLTLPLPSKGSGVDLVWRDESEDVTMRTGERRIRQRRLRGRIRWGYNALSRQEAEELIDALQDGVVLCTPRTARAGDPAIDELELHCQVTGDLPTTTEIARSEQDAIELQVELETVYTYASIRPLLRIGGDGEISLPPGTNPDSYELTKEDIIDALGYTPLDPAARSIGITGTSGLVIIQPETTQDLTEDRVWQFDFSPFNTRVEEVEDAAAAATAGTSVSTIATTSAPVGPGEVSILPVEEMADALVQEGDLIGIYDEEAEAIVPMRVAADQAAGATEIEVHDPDDEASGVELAHELPSGAAVYVFTKSFARRIVEHGGRLGEVEAKDTEQDGRLDAAEADIGILYSDTNDLEAEQLQQGTLISDLQDEQTDQDVRITTLETDIISEGDTPTFGGVVLTDVDYIKPINHAVHFEGGEVVSTWEGELASSSASIWFGDVRMRRLNGRLHDGDDLILLDSDVGTETGDLVRVESIEGLSRDIPVVHSLQVGDGLDQNAETGDVTVDIMPGGIVPSMLDRAYATAQHSHDQYISELSHVSLRGLDLLEVEYIKPINHSVDIDYSTSSPTVVSTWSGQYEESATSISFGPHELGIVEAEHPGWNGKRLAYHEDLETVDTTVYVDGTLNGDGSDSDPLSLTDGTGNLLHNHDGRYVRYNGAQSLSESQQEQVRANINVRGIGDAGIFQQGADYNDDAAVEILDEAGDPAMRMHGKSAPSGWSRRGLRFLNVGWGLIYDTPDGWIQLLGTTSGGAGGLYIQEETEGRVCTFSREGLLMSTKILRQGTLPLHGRRGSATNAAVILENEYDGDVIADFRGNVVGVPSRALRVLSNSGLVFYDRSTGNQHEVYVDNGNLQVSPY